jgi:hypothetical protein
VPQSASKTNFRIKKNSKPVFYGTPARDNGVFTSSPEYDDFSDESDADQRHRYVTDAFIGERVMSRLLRHLRTLFYPELWPPPLDMTRSPLEKSPVRHTRPPHSNYST